MKFTCYCLRYVVKVLYTNIDQTLVIALQGLVNCERGGLDTKLKTIYRVIIKG